MSISLNRRFIFGIALLFHSLLILGQYVVTGGIGTPLLALDDSPNRIQVWLVYGVENVTINYTSDATSAHEWRRYKTKALEAEAVVGITQSGNMSTLNKVEEGYGYFVEEQGLLPRYIWIIDYSRYVFSAERFGFFNNNDPCNEILLDGQFSMPPLYYHTPVGLQREIRRTFELSFNTMEWTAANKTFLPKIVTQTIEGNPLNQSFPPPLCDTEYILRGDLFARHFGVETNVSTDSYQAVAVEAHIDTVVTDMAGPNVVAGESSGFSGPLYVSFRPLANEPTSNWFRWTIYHQEKRDTIRAATVRDMDYTFTESGNYTIILETSDRTRTCVKTDSISLSISESFLHVPNAFSPGVSPGVNDVFKVAYKSIVTFRGWIFNRWGNELFRWTDPAQGWDGKVGGRYVSPGVYFYVIEAKGSDGKNYLEKGHINIIRSKNVHDQISEQ